MLKLGLVKKSFSYADIRRTAETLMAGLGVSDEHRAQVQSHGLSGVQLRHYNKYDYMKEKREALLKWEELVLGAKTRGHESPCDYALRRWTRQPLS